MVYCMQSNLAHYKFAGKSNSEFTYFNHKGRGKKRKNSKSIKNSL